MSKLITLDYSGMSVDFTGEAWFNATVVADRFGKRPAEWLRLAETKRYIAALAKRSKVHKSHFAKTKRGGRAGESGTWFHPKLAVAFARWLDIDFSIWCDEQIDLILRGGLADWRRSTPGERIPMYVTALEAGVARRTSWSHVVGWGNRFAGVRRSRLMSIEQVRETRSFFERLKEYQETKEDIRRIESNSIELYGESPQLPLLGPSA